MERKKTQTKQTKKQERPGGDRESGSRSSVGPTSIEGVEASDLPDGGRGNVETDPGHELGRHVPHHTGEVAGSRLNTDVGAAGKPESRQADQENYLGRHQGDK